MEDRSLEMGVRGREAGGRWTGDGGSGWSPAAGGVKLRVPPSSDFGATREGGDLKPET